MTSKKNEAEVIKALLFCHFRFKLGCLGVVSEFAFGRDTEDVVVWDEDKICVIEVKTSKQDFLLDFKTKVKHSQDKHSFDYFYFCVPYTLLHLAKESLINYPKYGLLILTQDNKIKSVKKATRLSRDDKNLDEIHYQLTKRMSSELANLKRKGIRNENN